MRMLFLQFHANDLLWKRKNVEILKIRFGEAALQVCEVMLRDMTDSKRIDGHVQSQKEASKKSYPWDAMLFCLWRLLILVHCAPDNHFAPFLALA